MVTSGRLLRFFFLPGSFVAGLVAGLIAGTGFLVSVGKGGGGGTFSATRFCCKKIKLAKTKKSCYTSLKK